MNKYAFTLPDGSTCSVQTESLESALMTVCDHIGVKLVGVIRSPIPVAANVVRGNFRNQQIAHR